MRRLGGSQLIEALRRGLPRFLRNNAEIRLLGRAAPDSGRSVGDLPVSRFRVLFKSTGRGKILMSTS